MICNFVNRIHIPRVNVSVKLSALGQSLGGFFETGSVITDLAR